MNGYFLDNFTENEAKTTLKHIHPFKSLGPNGIATTFYQNARAIVGWEVCVAVLIFKIIVF